MSAVATPGTVPVPTRTVDYLNARTGLASWFLTTDHKRIALLYMVSITALFILGGAAAGAMRIHLLTPSGALFTDPDTYNRMFTLHGITMVFFFLIPSIPAVLGNFLIPLMVGARDLAFPRLNLASWYIYVLGTLFGLWALVYGGVDTGWTFYTPYSTTTATQVDAVVLAIVIVGVSSMLTALNFVVTVNWLRAPGLTFFRLPLFVWTIYATSAIILLATPVLAITLLMVGLERVARVGIFDPALGGDPLLFQHLFWFYSHPAVYIMLLPGMGVVSEIIPCFARKALFGYHWVALATIAIAVLGFLVWGHHMFVAGISADAALVFSLLSFMVAIPSAIKVFNWTATLYRGAISLATPMLYALGFVGLFTVGGLTGLWLASLAADVDLHDTYFVIAHFHYIMVGGSVMAYFGGLHYWWPKITGRMYPEILGKIAAVTIFLGFNLTFFPQFLLGYLGMPRRYATYPPEFQFLNVLSTAGTLVLAVGYFLPMVYFLPSFFQAADAGANPWGATGLEWQTGSPPPPDNFVETPVVTAPPYQYHRHGETVHSAPRGEGGR